jgi:sulfur-oxidizing protein SoxZ
MNARLFLPKKIVTGEVINIRLLIQHPMETGYLQDMTGHLIPRNVIQWVNCVYNDQEVFRVETSSGISANPFFEFYVRANVTAFMSVKWQDDSGQVGELKQLIPVQA